MNLVGFCQPAYANRPLFRLCSLQAYLMPCSLTNFSKLTHHSLALHNQHIGKPFWFLNSLNPPLVSLELLSSSTVR